MPQHNTTWGNNMKSQSKFKTCVVQNVRTAAKSDCWRELP